MEADSKRSAVGTLEVARIKFTELVSLKEQRLSLEDWKRAMQSLSDLAVMLPKLRPTT